MSRAMEAQYGGNNENDVPANFSFFFLSFEPLDFGTNLNCIGSKSNITLEGSVLLSGRGNDFSHRLKREPSMGPQKPRTPETQQCCPTLRPQKRVEMELELILTHVIILQPIVNKSPIKKNVSFLFTFSSCSEKFSDIEAMERESTSGP